MVIARPKFITAAAAMTPDVSRMAFTPLLREANENFEERLFSPDRLAPELPTSLQTPDTDFPCYFPSASIPIAPADWTVKVDGLIKQPRPCSPMR